MSYLFLYRIKKESKHYDDRDCCAYIDASGSKFVCDHYYSRLSISGPCYCGGKMLEYDDIETYLTREEYEELIRLADEINALGYGIKKEGDKRYNKGVELVTSIAYIINKLKSDEAMDFFEDIQESEMEYLKDKWSLNDNDIEQILDTYASDYGDRSIVSYVFKDSDELGYEEAWELGYIKNNDSISYKYFDYERFGSDLVNEDERYLELNDGRVVCFSY